MLQVQPERIGKLLAISCKVQVLETERSSSSHCMEQKPDGLYFHPDLAERTLQRRRSQVPEMSSEGRKDSILYKGKACDF